MTLDEKLADIQQKLNVPKDRDNDHGGFKYRSVEDILAALKPYTDEHKLLLTLNDEVIRVDEKIIYVFSLARLKDLDSGEVIECKGWARDCLERKGMDAAQITGTASSYARKRALGGLFLIDDETDADSITNTQYGKIRKACREAGVDCDAVSKTLYHLPVKLLPLEKLADLAERVDAAIKKYKEIDASNKEEIPMP